MNGGAVNDDKSPLNDAIDLRNEVHSAVRDILCFGDQQMVAIVQRRRKSDSYYVVGVADRYAV